MPDPMDGEILVKTLWLSLDPYLHSRMKRSSDQAEPVNLGDVMIGLAVGEVVESRHERFQPGELVYSIWDAWQEYALPEPSKLRKVDHRIQKPSHVLGALNVPGFAGYLALNDIAQAQPGETVVVGTATGAFGQFAGQMAKNKGCRVVGIVGHAEKRAFATEQVGYDACVSYRGQDLPTALSEACPDGIDVYLETIGGKTTEAVVRRMNHGGRIVVCGMMSLITSTGKPKASMTSDALLNETMNKRLSIQGLISFDYFRDRFGAFQEEMIGWLDEGVVVQHENVVDGLENAPLAFQGMFGGLSQGKLVVQVADPGAD